MPSHRKGIGNNSLAALAILLIAVSLMNLSMSLSLLSHRQSPIGMSAGAGGQVSACMGLPPEITGAAYHEPVQGLPYYYDFNATGENASEVTYSDNSTLFNISSLSGIVSFTPGNGDVGISTVVIFATEILCSSSNYTIVTFNVTNFNDPPYLVSLFIQNATGNATYDFPINTTVELYEDSWYNLSVIADDPDLHVPPPVTEALTYGKIPPGFFVLNETTGNVTFMPVQSDVGTYSFRFNVVDASYEVDESGWVSIVVHNVNDDPVLQNKTDLIGGIGAMNVDWGADFHYDINATDEDGDAPQFHVDFLNCTRLDGGSNCTIFGINQSTGEINFTPPFSYIGNYTVNYTVTDGNGGVDWYVGSFSVNEWGNMPPNITLWDPYGYNVTIFEGESVTFHVNVTDDNGLPMCSWLMDSAEIEDQTGPCTDFESSYTYGASYEDSGVYNITIMVGDGQFVVMHQWRLVVLDKEPPAEIPKRSWGRAEVPACIENWRCTAWSDCSKEGIQIRVCVDLSNCSTALDRPQMTRYCTYTPEPTCYDGVQNCHDGLCEILADCGGPCSSCPTCSDGILNCHANGQCEEGTDCGGPCRPCVTLPYMPVCGNSVCEAGELYDCADDCADFWIDVAIFVMIIILLVTVSILLYVYRKETVLLYIYRRMRGE